jgi:hypothetical protein
MATVISVSMCAELCASTESYSETSRLQNSCYMAQATSSNDPIRFEDQVVTGRDRNMHRH